MLKNEENYCVSGLITIPICFLTTASSKNTALEYVRNKLNKDTISVIHGDIYTWDSPSYPLTAEEINIEWNNVLPMRN